MSRPYDRKSGTVRAIPEAKDQWYVLHVLSNKEDRTVENLNRLFKEDEEMNALLQSAPLVPKEKVEDVRNGKKYILNRKLYPGYVFVKMVYSDDTWHVIRNVRGVAGFVGASGNDPFPLTEDEVYEMGVEKREIVVNYVVGDTVRILDGPLSSFTGVVESIEVDKNSVSVIVSMFGRETPVEFELDQVEPISQ